MKIRLDINTEKEMTSPVEEFFPSDVHDREIIVSSQNPEISLPLFEFDAEEQRETLESVQVYLNGEIVNFLSQEPFQSGLKEYLQYQKALEQSLQCGSFASLLSNADLLNIYPYEYSKEEIQTGDVIYIMQQHFGIALSKEYILSKRGPYSLSVNHIDDLITLYSEELDEWEKDALPVRIMKKEDFPENPAPSLDEIISLLWENPLFKQQHIETWGETNSPLFIPDFVESHFEF